MKGRVVLRESNSEIREILRARKIPIWRVSDQLCMHENTLLRKLRRELEPELKEKVLAAISTLEKEGK